MPDLQTQLHAYGDSLDRLYPDVDFHEILEKASPPSRRRIPVRRGVALALAVAIVVLASIGGVALLNLFGGSEPPVVTQPESPSTSGPPVPTNELLTWQGYWPQTSLAEIQFAQQRADDGDQSFDWQMRFEPSEGTGAAVGAEIATRYVEEVLGWPDYWMVGGGGSEGFSDLVFIECVPAAQNPLYPADPKGKGCAPTLDESHYRTVTLRVEQPVRQGTGGLWVVTSVNELVDSDEPLYSADWSSRQYEQVVPATEEELRAFVELVSEARLAGTGVEQYLMPPAPGASLLYSTTGGLEYETYEFVRVDWGPAWPDGTYRVVVRMIADRGNVVVEQAFLIHHAEDGSLRLNYGLGEGTENGESVALTYGILGGEISWRVPEPWSSPWMLGVMEGDESIVVGGVEGAEVYFVVLSDPWIPEGECAASGRVGFAEEQVEAIIANPALDVGLPADVVVGGVPAVRLDVVALAGTAMCPGTDEGASADPGIPVVMHQDNGHAWSVDRGARMRIYLLEVPGTAGPRPVAIMIRAPDDFFEEALTAAEPMVGSFVFESP